MLQPVIFTTVTIAAFGLASRSYLRIRRNILLGLDEPVEGPRSARWRNVLLVAFGQKKMFQNWLPAVFHFFIYAAFVITQTELIEILADGVTGEHRMFATALGGFYTFVIGFIEVLSVLAFVATIIFLARRNLLKVPRFHKPEMKGWPFADGNLILFGEILLLTGMFSMNGADTVLQNLGAAHYTPTGNFAVSSWLGPALFGHLEQLTLVGVERFGWWLHILTVYAFLNYLPISKHLHILLAFPNTWYARLTPRGQLKNMPEIQREVAAMFQPEAAAASAGAEEEALPVFGANDVFSLSRRYLLAAYSCTECGRCTAACPANITGKRLSPRKIMMDVRDRLDEVSRNIAGKDPRFFPENPAAAMPNKLGYDDGKSLFDYISREEIHACTTCNACVQACPVLINPLDIILELRRYEILVESAGPSDWLPLFNSLENSQSAWAMSVPRDAWNS